ncbi:MAG: hypothetical protein ACI94Y_002618 [Maribacter sp.]|jgi:hypothetical protein
MIRSIIFLTCILIPVLQLATAQHTNEHNHNNTDEIIRCGFISTNPSVMENAVNFERWMDDKKTNLASRDGEEVINIPVIFHILHQGQAIGTGYNLSEEQINAQIDQVNNDLRRMTGSSGFNSFAEGADTKIQLVPAIYDENDNELVEDGINRVNTATVGLGTGSFSKNYMNSTVKPQTQWNPELYLNIWVAPLSVGLLGFGQFPEASSLDGVNSNGTASTDGVVILYKSVGSTDNPNALATGGYANYNKGRTLTHELGHWLGLRHTWGDGGCSTDDYCSDTPPTGYANYNCNSASSCGHNDMIENYMDYTYDACMSVFTLDQKTRMTTVMLNSPRRLPLMTSDRAGVIGTPLPVELIDYNVKLVEDHTISTWSTTTETNNSHFIVSKSSDGIRYEDVSIIEGKGNSSELSSYEFIDDKLFVGNNYYRLTQVDIDRKATQLGTRIVAYFSGLDIKLAPNPAKSYVNLKFFSKSDKATVIQIYNVQGKLLQGYEKTVDKGTSQMRIDIASLQTGMYIIRVIQDDKQQITKRFNKIL